MAATVTLHGAAFTILPCDAVDVHTLQRSSSVCVGDAAVYAYDGARNVIVRCARRGNTLRVSGYWHTPYRVLNLQPGPAGTARCTVIELGPDMQRYARNYMLP